MELTRIAGYGHVAQKYGLEEAIFLESIMYWWRTNKANGRNFRDGRTWTYNTIKALSKIFPWWTVKQVRRIADSCRDKGALIVGSYNEDGRDRTIWYSPSNDLLALYGEAPVDVPAPEPPPEGEEQGESNCPNGQMHLPERADSFAQMGEALPCIYHDGTNNTPLNPPEGDERAPDDPPEPEPPKRRTRKKKTKEPKKVPDWNPKRFAQFWDYYGMKVNKQRAIEEWDKLCPDDALIDHMARTLKRQKASEMWQRGIGIPQPAQWIKDRRWEDEDVGPACPQAPPEPKRTWTDDPEVTS